MATKAEKVHAEEQRHGPSPKTKKRANAKKMRAENRVAPHETKRAGKKASYARETVPAKTRASRKSTRSSANRAKPDTNLTLREGRAKGSPESRYRKSRARTSRVRGSTAAR